MADKEMTDWVRWPDGVPGTQLLSVRVEKPVDEVFLLLHGPTNDFVQKFNAAVGNRDYVATDWKTSTNQLAGDGSTPPDLAALRPGWIRRVGFGGTSMGSAYTTTELEQVLAAAPGRRFATEACVATTASYGDKFRPVVQHTITSLGPGAAHVAVRGTVVFVGRVNGLIRGLIERGARDGMAKNYAAYHRVLAEFAAVSDAPEPEAGEVVATPGPQPQTPPAAMLPAELPRIVVALVGTEMASALAPWAALLQSALPGGGTVPALALHIALCTLGVLGGLQIILRMLVFLRRASDEPGDIVAASVHFTFKVLDFPESSHQVLVAALLLVAVRALLGVVAGFIPPPPPPQPRIVAPPPPAAPTGISPNTPGKSDAVKAAPVSTSVVADASPGPLTAETEGVMEGVKYEGYCEAIISAQGQGTQVSPTSAISPSSPSGVPLPVGAAAVTSLPGAESLPVQTGTASKDKVSDIDRMESDDGQGNAERLLSPRSRARDLSAPTDKQAGGRAVIEEIFENERLQPFRGWGHSWPGHFLPTDRVAHWSLREVAGKPLVASQEFKRVVPRVQPGWRWVESTWHLDRSGSIVDAVDTDGWAYGLDFGWLVFPFPEDGGYKKYSDFVRRRRWIRTRVPIDPDQPNAPATAAPEAEDAVMAAAPGSAVLPPPASPPAVHRVPTFPPATERSDSLLVASIVATAVAKALLAADDDDDGGAAAKAAAGGQSASSGLAAGTPVAAEKTIRAGPTSLSASQDLAPTEEAQESPTAGLKVLPAGADGESELDQAASGACDKAEAAEQPDAGVMLPAPTEGLEREDGSGHELERDVDDDDDRGLEPDSGHLML